MTRTEARMIAEELYKLMRPKLEATVKEIAERELDEWLDAKEAAKLLGWSLKTIYNKISELPHTKSGKKLRFSRNALLCLMKR